VLLNTTSLGLWGLVGPLCTSGIGRGGPAGPRCPGSALGTRNFKLSLDCRRLRRRVPDRVGLGLVCVFVTAAPNIKLFAWGEGNRGRHVLRETTSRGLCGLVCPSRTGERGGEGDCVKEGGGEEGAVSRVLDGRVGDDRRGSPRYPYNAGSAGLVDGAGTRHASGVCLYYCSTSVCLLLQ
jgi:hypothetical protein